MANLTTLALVRQIESLFTSGSVTGLSDRQLLERFVASRDPGAEAAFAALVGRHGPMVLDLCRLHLRDRHLAEDAFQAVFLVLARRARSVRDPDLLANWLYGVTLRTARKAKVQLTRLRKKDHVEAMYDLRSGTPADELAIERERAQALHDEIDRLPDAFRLPVVLCYFEGLTVDEAARRLRCPAGTIGSRLARAREKLRHGLTRRGVVLSAAALTAVLDTRPASAAVSSPLCDMTTRAAIQFTAGQAVSHSAMALAREVLRSMLIHKLRLIVTTLVFVSALATSVGSLTRALTLADETKPQPAAAQVPVAAKPNDAIPGPAPGRMIVVGRVLDPEGKPVPNASAMVYASLKQPGRADQSGGMAGLPIGEARSDPSGRFRIDAARTSSSIHEEAGVVAITPGYGAGWVALDLDADQPKAEITLRPEQVISGRVFGIQGQPVAGVRVWVAGMGHVIRDPEGDPEDDNIDGPAFLDGNHAKTDLPAWPRTVVTDAEGRYTVRGAGRNLRIYLVTDHPRFSRRIIKVDTDNAPSGKRLVTVVEPARIFFGRVTAADTGKPIAKAVVAGNGGDTIETNADGQFRVTAESSDRCVVMVNAPRGQPYLNVRTKEFEWPKGAIEHRVDVVLPRGTLIRGKVTESGSGKPIAGTTLGYFTRSIQGAQFDWFVGQAWAEPDGSFQLAVPPKSKHLIVLGPSEDYVLQEAGERMILDGQPGGRRMYAHAFIPYDLKDGGDIPDIPVVLRRGMTVKGQVIGPDGQPVLDARMVSRIILMPSGSAWRSWQGSYHGPVRNGRFELHGLAADPEIPVFFFEPKRRLGAVVNLSGNSESGGPVTVRLETCGTARARLVDPAGKPIAGYRDPYLVVMVVAPGPSWLSRDPVEMVRLAAEEDFSCRIDPVNYPEGVVADDQGRVVLHDLIPGATYRIIDVTTPKNDGPGRLRKEFTMKPGESVDLGDIRIEKPEA